MAGTLVVYYSRKGENHMPGGIQVLEKGNTEYAAEYIAKAKARPEIKGYVEDISAYDTIFVCFPCWCGTAPMCVFTFLEHYDLSGKKIAPLCTNEGSGLANSEKDLAESCKGATILSGLSVRGHQAKDSYDVIAAWAKEKMN